MMMCKVLINVRSVICKVQYVRCEDGSKGNSKGDGDDKGNGNDNICDILVDSATLY